MVGAASPSSVGFAYLLFRGPLVPGLLAMGAVLALSLWWGPGSRRVRVPTRRLVLGLTRRRWLGWLAVAVVVATAALLAYGLLSDGVVWDPAAGPPWRAGTTLGTCSAGSERGSPMTDWQAWHREYDDPESDLSRRRRSVQRQVEAWLDERPGRRCGW